MANSERRVENLLALARGPGAPAAGLSACAYRSFYFFGLRAPPGG